MLPLYPVFSGCTRFGVAATVKTNGCAIVPESGTGEPMSGDVGIWECKSPMTFSSGACTVAIGNQTDAGTATYTVLGTGENREIIAKLNLNSLTVTQTGGIVCPTGTYHNGVYKGEWRIKASSPYAPFGQTGIWIG